MAGNNIFYIISAQDKFSRVLNKFDRQLSKIQKESDKAGKTIKKFSVESFMASTRWRILFGAAALSVGAFTVNSVEGFRTMEAEIKNTTGSADEAAKVMGKLAEMSMRVPVPLKTLAESTRILLSHNYTQQQALKITTELAKVSPYLGKSLTSLAARYVMINQRRRVTSLMMRDFNNKGIGVYKTMRKLALQLGVTDKQFVNAFNKGRLSAKLFDAALVEMTKKGGVAYSALQDRSETLGGSLILLNSILKNYALILSKAFFGNITLGKAIYKVDMLLASMADRLKTFTEQHPIIFKTIGIFISMVAVLSAAAIGLKIVAAAFMALAIAIRGTLLISLIGGLFTILTSLTAALLPQILIISAFSAALYGLYKVAKFVYTFLKAHQAKPGTRGYFTGVMRPAAPAGIPLIPHLGALATAKPAAGEKKHRIDIHIHDPAKRTFDITGRSDDPKTRFNVGRNMLSVLGVD